MYVYLASFLPTEMLMESAVETMWFNWSDLCHMMSHNQEHLLLAGILTPEFQINKYT